MEKKIWDSSSKVEGWTDAVLRAPADIETYLGSACWDLCSKYCRDKDWLHPGEAKKSLFQKPKQKKVQGFLVEKFHVKKNLNNKWPMSPPDVLGGLEEGWHPILCVRGSIPLGRSRCLGLSRGLSAGQNFRICVVKTGNGALSRLVQVQIQRHRNISINWLIIRKQLKTTWRASM